MKNGKTVKGFVISYSSYFKIQLLFTKSLVFESK